MKLPRRQFLHSGSGRCRAPGRVVDCVGTNLSDAAGALDRRLSPGGVADVIGAALFDHSRRQLLRECPPSRLRASSYSFRLYD